MEEPFLIIYNYFLNTNVVGDNVEGMFNQKNYFILEYTNLLICRACMFPLVAVPPQRYLVLISKYNYTNSVLYPTGIVNLLKLLLVYLKMLFPYFPVFSQVD